MIFNLTATDMTKVESMLANIGGGEKMLVPSETVRYTFDGAVIISESGLSESDQLYYGTSLHRVKWMMCYIPCAGDICIKLYDVSIVNSKNSTGVSMNLLNALCYSNKYKRDTFPSTNDLLNTEPLVLESNAVGLPEDEKSQNLQFYVIMHISQAGIYNFQVGEGLSVSKAEICYDFSDTFYFTKWGDIT